MWVYEEVVNGRNLTEIINSEHVNVKYLPEIALPENLQVYTAYYCFALPICVPIA